MEVIITLIAIVFIISLYDYYSSRSWQQVSSAERNDLVFEGRNQVYGAYEIRKKYDKRLLFIMLSVFLSISLIYGSWVIYKNLPEEAKVIPPVDTTQMSIPAPPLDEEEPPPPPPPDEPPPPVEETFKFVAPVVSDEQVAEEVYIPIEDEKVSTETVEGSKESFNDEENEIFAPPEDNGPVVQDKPEVIETFVDEEAEFPGGYPAMMAWIQKNLAFPETAIENNVQGKCFLRFVVSIDGNIKSVTVTKGVPDCPECDKAAIKAIRSMPKWKAGKLNGRSVSSYCSIPINFAIE
jgi:periplasmic protein TonB